MNKNVEFLNFIYQNSKMGIIGIESIKKSIHDDEFLKVINEQNNDYYSICTKAIKLLSFYNNERQNVSQMAKVMTYMDAHMKLMKDESINNIAKMMIEGNTKGVVEITEKIRIYSEADKQVVKLAKELLKIEKRNINNLKKYI